MEERLRATEKRALLEIDCLRAAEVFPGELIFFAVRRQFSLTHLKALILTVPQRAAKRSFLRGIQAP